MGQVRNRVVTEPAVEPVTLEEVKTHLNITFDDDDTYLAALIPAARAFIEDYLGRKLIAQELEDYHDRFPFSFPWWGGVKEYPRSYFQSRVLGTFYFPVISVDQVSTFAEDGTETVYADSNYSVDVISDSLPARIVLKDSASWPSGLRKENAVKVAYTAGYGAAASDVPAQIRHGLLEALMYLYVNRGACSDMGQAIETSGAFMFLRPYRVRNI